MNAMSAGPHADDPEVWNDEQWNSSAIGDESGYGYDLESVFYDSLSNEPLDAKDVQEGRKLELDWIGSMETYVKVPHPDVLRGTGAPT